jgi:uncharacterized membrane protein
MTAQSPGEAITLSAWTFGTLEGASRAAAVLKDLVERGLVQVVSAAVVGWSTTARAPRMLDVVYPPTAGMSQRPEFLDLLFGMTYAVPLLEAAVVAAPTDRAAGLVGIGVGETFTNTLRDRLVPGSSALLLLSGNDAVARLRSTLDRPDALELMSTPVEIPLDPTDS